jgi:pyruvate/2-oxoglutarate dehydrogenase complex dihydrolipoamide dehydrogenase (E3) component
MDTFDFVIIGAGPAGEAAAYKARELGATVAVIDRLWFGGSCPHIGCLPSKSLLDGAARHAANPTRYRWSDASAARDYMVNRPPDAAEPDDSSHLRRLREAGVVAYRGSATIAGQGRVTVSHDEATHELATANVVVAVGSVSKRPPVEGLDAIPVWTNRQATLARELPASLLILGGGPTGCEIAQVYVRFGVPTTIVQSGPRLAPTDHPRNSEVVRAALERCAERLRIGFRCRDLGHQTYRPSRLRNRTQRRFPQRFTTRVAAWRPISPLPSSYSRARAPRGNSYRRSSRE